MQKSKAKAVWNKKKCLLCKERLHLKLPCQQVTILGIVV